MHDHLQVQEGFQGWWWNGFLGKNDPFTGEERTSDIVLIVIQIPWWLIVDATYYATTYFWQQVVAYFQFFDSVPFLDKLFPFLIILGIAGIVVVLVCGSLFYTTMGIVIIFWTGADKEIALFIETTWNDFIAWLDQAI